MLTLALDTTGEHGSIALVRGGEVVEEVSLHAPQGFSGVIFPQIAALLDRHGLKLPGIELFAAASGPGSFTGVRIGLAAVKSLAEVNQRSAASVSNLRALAEFGSSLLRATVIDARRGEIYAALWDATGNLLLDERVCAPDNFLAALPQEPVEWIGTDPLILPTRPDDLVVTAPLELAGVIGRLAQRAPVQPEALDANYVRRSDAEIFWKEV